MSEVPLDDHDGSEDQDEFVSPTNQTIQRALALIDDGVLVKYCTASPGSKEWQDYQVERLLAVNNLKTRSMEYEKKAEEHNAADKAMEVDDRGYGLPEPISEKSQTHASAHVSNGPSTILKKIKKLGHIPIDQDQLQPRDHIIKWKEPIADTRVLAQIAVKLPKRSSYEKLTTINGRKSRKMSRSFKGTSIPIHRSTSKRKESRIAATPDQKNHKGNIQRQTAGKDTMAKANGKAATQDEGSSLTNASKKHTENARKNSLSIPTTWGRATSTRSKEVDREKAVKTKITQKIRNSPTSQQPLEAEGAGASRPEESLDRKSQNEHVSTDANNNQATTLNDTTSRSIGFPLRMVGDLVQSNIKSPGKARKVTTAVDRGAQTETKVPPPPPLPISTTADNNSDSNGQKDIRKRQLVASVPVNSSNNTRSRSLDPSIPPAQTGSRPQKRLKNNTLLELDYKALEALLGRIKAPVLPDLQVCNVLPGTPGWDTYWSDFNKNISEYYEAVEKYSKQMDALLVDEDGRSFTSLLRRRHLDEQALQMSMGLTIPKPPLIREPLKETVDIGGYVIRALGGEISGAFVTKYDHSSFRLEIEMDTLDTEFDSIGIDTKSNIMTIMIPSAGQKELAYKKIIQISVPQFKNVQNLQIDNPLYNGGRIVVSGK